MKIYLATMQNLRKIVDYLNMLSLRLQSYNITKKIASFAWMSKRCPKPGDLALAMEGDRYLVVGNYLIFCAVVGDTVQIRRI